MILKKCMFAILLGFIALIVCAADEADILEPVPHLTFIQATVDDSVDGNNNAILEPGETARIAVRVFNMGTATAWQAYGQLNSNAVDVTINDNIALFGDILPKNIVQSQAPHFEVTISKNIPCGSTLTFQLALNATNHEETITFPLMLRAIPDKDMALFSEDVRAYGPDNDDSAGISVFSGDINGDGYDDLILGAHTADGPGNVKSNAGEVWVIYSSSSGLAISIDLATPPANSSVIYGADTIDYAGASVSAGDIDGDGYDDLILGANGAGGPSNGRPAAGEVWILYGSASGLGASVDLSTSPANAAVIFGADTNDYTGISVASADINGDGYDDLILGANGADGPGNGRSGAGEAWVLYGSVNGLLSVDLSAPPANSSVIYGADINDYAGISVSSGDIDGDGYEDLILGAYAADGPDNITSNAGEAWVLYGSASGLGASIDLATPPANSSVIYGADALDNAGYRASSGDINGDGYDDIILGVHYADGPGNGKNSAGEAWILYGSASGLGASIDLSIPPLTASVIYGADAGDRLSSGLSSGDINSDGYDDIIAGAYNADGPGNGKSNAGEAWIIYGSANGLGASIDLSTPPANSSVIFGADSGDYAGYSVSSGDCDRDGYGDIFIGAPNADGPNNGRTDGGEAALVYGKLFDFYYIKPDTYSFIDATPGSIINLNCDTCCTEFDIGFAFSFYSDLYTKLYICDDGYITFSPFTSPSSINLCMPDRHYPDNLIAAFWDNLNPSQGGSVYAFLEGTTPNRRLTIEWLNVPHYPNTGNATFEITLFETSNQILVQYQDTIFGTSADNGALAMAGVENRTGANGKKFSCTQPVLTNSTAWRAIPISQYRLFYDDMESGINGWSVTGTPVPLWHQEAASCIPNYRSPSTSWYYGQNSTCNYNTGATNSGTLTSPSIAADYYSYLYHWFRRQVESTGSNYDKSIIQVSEDGGPMTNHEQITIIDNIWHYRETDFSSHSEHAIQLGFFFDTVDGANNNYLGWMIDNVEVWGCNIYGTSPIIALAYANPTPVCETASYLLDGTGSYASGCGTLLYQWYENGSPIFGADSLTYTVPAGHAPGTFAYTLEVTCATNPTQTDISDPAYVEVVALPPEVPTNSLLVSKISAGAELHFTWADVSGASSYFLFSDTIPAGTFANEEGSSTSGIVGLDLLMPTQPQMFYLVAGYNAVCGLGPK